MTAPVCSTNLSWSRQVRGSKGDLYNVTFGERYDSTVGWSCTCPDYRLRRQAKGEVCKHIRVASSWRCCWNAELDPTRTLPEPSPQTGSALFVGRRSCGPKRYLINFVLSQVGDMDPSHPAWKAKSASMFDDSLWIAIQNAFHGWADHVFLPILSKDLKGAWSIDSSHPAALNQMQVSCALSAADGSKLNVYLGLDGSLHISIFAAYYAPGARDVTERYKGKIDSFSGSHAASSVAHEMNAAFKI
jgi:hypothetical protein